MVAGEVWQPCEFLTDDPGIRYDSSTNTLTLHNFTGPLLDINLMGNGFTIKLEGENHLEMLRVWGFGYGGSVTLTGNGSLTINADRTNPIGIVLQAEISQSCLMIDKEVTLDVYGTEMAICVIDTTLEKAIYYKNELTLTGGICSIGDFYPSYYDAYDYSHDYSVVDTETGIPATHVTCKP